MRTLIGLAILTVILYLASCTQPPEQDNRIDASSPSATADSSVPAVSSKPELLETGKFDQDDRYVVEFKGYKFHVIAGENGLLAVKAIAPDETLDWDSLWITFSPPQTRPRTHTEQDLSEPGAPLPYVSDDIAPLVNAAREMAALIVPGVPALGDERRAGKLQSTVKGVALSATAANELALFSRSLKLSVAENLPLDEEKIPPDIRDSTSLRLDRLFQKAGYTPVGSWYNFSMEARGEQVNYLVLIPVAGQPIVLVQYQIHGVDNRDSVYRYQGGKYSATYFSERTSLKGDVITDAQRRLDAYSLRFLDEGMAIPPDPHANALRVYILAAQQKEKLDSFSSDLVPKMRTLGDMLVAFEAGLPF